MKKILLLAAINFIAASAFSQFIHKIKADSVLITNDSCNAELNLENSTRNVKGFLYNKGNGRTEFRKGILKVNDSIYIIGGDTLNPCACLARIKAVNGLTKTNDSIKLGGDLLESTVINMKDKRITLRLSDGAYSTANSAGLTITGARTTYNGNDFLYLQSFHRPTTTAGGYSAFAETFYQPTNTITSGSYTNYISVHKSDNASVNMSGMSMYGFKSLFRVLQTGQQYGNMYHFYGYNTASTTLAGMSNHYGLYLESLKLPNTGGTYAIYTAGAEDSVYNAGPVRWTKYKNNGSEDSVLTTDVNGNIKLKVVSGGSGPSTVKLTSDLSAYTSTSLADATGLSFSVAANTYYHFKFQVVFSSAAAANGLKLSVSIPSSPDVFSANASIPVAVGSLDDDDILHGFITASNDAVVGEKVQAANTNYVAIVEGILLTGGTSGTLQLRYASETSSGVTIKKASMGQLTVY